MTEQERGRGMVKRIKACWIHSEENTEGECVRYTDYQSLETELYTLTKERDALLVANNKRKK